MGKKFTQFMSALGGALNENVYMVNQQQKAAETAEQSRVDDNNLKVIMGDVSAKMALLQEMGVDDPRAKKIVEGMKRSVANAPEQYKKALIGSVGDELALTAGIGGKKKGTEKSAVQFILPDGQEVPAFQEGKQFTYRDKSGTLVPLPYGSKKAASKQLQGKMTSSQFKERASDEDTETALRQNITNIETLRKEYASENYVGGVTGEGLKLLGSAIAQYKQVTGGESLLDKDGNVNESLLDPNKSTSWIKKAARTGSKIESQQLEQAFLLAKMLNPDGKISDADVRNAYDILGKGADQKTMLTLLRSAQERQVSNENIRRQVRSKNRDSKYEPLSVKGILSLPGGSKQETGKTKRRKLFEY